MKVKVFVSYAHKQGPWVWDRLVPVLKASGAEVLIDRERFQAGHAVVRQMDTAQDEADRQLICWSADHATSDACRHEWHRAVAKDPSFAQGLILLARLDDSALPPEFPTDRKQWPLYSDLRDAMAQEPWNLLLQACGADLGTTAPAWLKARDEVEYALKNFKSVNLVVLTQHTHWRELLKDVQERSFPDLALVDLQAGHTVTREGLQSAILRALGMTFTEMPERPNDLGTFNDWILSLNSKVRIGLTHFDLVRHRAAYDIDFFANLRFLIMDHPKRPITLCIQSRAPLGNLLPDRHPLSDIDCATVELR